MLRRGDSKASLGTSKSATATLRPKFSTPVASGSTNAAGMPTTFRRRFFFQGSGAAGRLLTAVEASTSTAAPSPCHSSSRSPQPQPLAAEEGGSGEQVITVLGHYLSGREIFIKFIARRIIFYHILVYLIYQ